MLPALLVMLALGARAFAGDTTAPKVTDVMPLPGATLAAEPATIAVTFDEPIDPATVSTSSFRLVRSGGDGTFADGNEVEIALASVSLTTATVATVDLAGARLPNDVYQVTVSGTPLPTAGLVAHWGLDEGTDATASDASGNGHDGVLTNGPTWDLGKHGAAVSFDGINDYVDIPRSSVFDFVNADFSVAVWVKA
jgi:hypothetical protein